MNISLIIYVLKYTRTHTKNNDGEIDRAVQLEFRALSVCLHYLVRCRFRSIYIYRRTAVTLRRQSTKEELDAFTEKYTCVALLRKRAVVICERTTTDFTLGGHSEKNWLHELGIFPPPALFSFSLLLLLLKISWDRAALSGGRDPTMPICTRALKPNRSSYIIHLFCVVRVWLYMCVCAVFPGCHGESKRKKLRYTTAARRWITHPHTLW